MNKLCRLILCSILLFVFCAFQPGPKDQPDSFIKALSFSKEDLKNKTAVYTLEGGGESLLARLWFIQHAQTSIDIQYYSFAKDITGIIATDHIIRAAERGVKIRLLIDDAASKMYSYEIRMLDLHENIEVKVYNAGVILGRPDRRLKFFLKNYKRLLRRMHNKTFTIDKSASIIGGRNIADRYFDYDKKYNFRDRDVLLMGKAVEEVNSSFDKFWNDHRTVAYTELSGRKKRKKDNSKYYERLHERALNTKKFSVIMRQKVTTYADTIKKAERLGKLVWTSQASFISDIPGKNEDKKDRTGGICADSMLNLIKQAKVSIDIQSPYFIITKEAIEIINDAIKRGIKIRLLTNSLSSTDNFMAFSAYQRDRAEVLKTGIIVYEFKPDSKVRYKLMVPEVQPKLNYRTVYGFHSKTIIIDNSIAVVGSYNVDPRSANYNTECVAVFRSKEISQNLLGIIEEEFQPENSWPVTNDCNPDHKAKLIKKVKAFCCRIVPKKYL